MRRVRVEVTANEVRVRRRVRREKLLRVEEEINEEEGLLPAGITSSTTVVVEA